MRHINIIIIVGFLFSYCLPCKSQCVGKLIRTTVGLMHKADSTINTEMGINGVETVYSPHMKSVTYKMDECDSVQIIFSYGKVAWIYLFFKKTKFLYLKNNFNLSFHHENGLLWVYNDKKKSKTSKNKHRYLINLERFDRFCRVRIEVFRIINL